MILDIDVGNTNIVIGCIEDGKILNIVRLQTRVGETETEYAIKLRQLLEFYNIDTQAFEGVILSSVVPPVTAVLQKAVKMVTGVTCMVVGPGMKTGLNLRIDDPGTLAGDLLVGAVAAMNGYGCPAIVMDLGTATTMTVIDRDGCFRGGAILPGIKLGYAALAAGTSLLPDISVSMPRRVIATNTVDAMRSGAVYATAAMIDGMIERMEEELGYSCRVIATGGLASVITPYCKKEIVCDENLLMKGLWALYEKNSR